MAFTTVTGSNGVTSLVGTTGIDVATIVTLSSNVFVGGNTADDTLTTGLATGNNVAADYNVRMGGGNDTVTIGNNVVNSYISLDGEILANDGDDTFTSAGNLLINSEIVGRGGNDAFGAAAAGVALNGSTLNGNTGTDTIFVGGSAASFVYGGKDSDTITTTANSSTVLLNGNKGSDRLALGGAVFASGSVYGGNGNDVLSGGFVQGATGALLTANEAGALFSGDLGNDTIGGTAGIDTINGGDGADVIFGGATISDVGVVALTATDGADVIDGGAGNDTITGAAGGDTITGGAGNNVFVYTTLTDATVRGNSGFDTITDFKANTADTAPPTTATANGDRFDLAATPAAAAEIITVNFAGNAGGATNLQTALGNVNFTAAGQDIALVTITGAFSYAGNYMVINADAGVGAYNNTTDAVIKMNTFANIGVNTVICFHQSLTPSPLLQGAFSCQLSEQKDREGSFCPSELSGPVSAHRQLPKRLRHCSDSRARNRAVTREDSGASPRFPLFHSAR